MSVLYLSKEQCIYTSTRSLKIGHNQNQLMLTFLFDSFINIKYFDYQLSQLSQSMVTSLIK